MAPPRSEEEDDPSEPPPPKALPSLVSPRFHLLLGVQFVFGLGFSSFLLLPKYMTQVHGADRAHVPGAARRPLGPCGTCAQQPRPRPRPAPVANRARGWRWTREYS